jgi:hypothetical protein
MQHLIDAVEQAVRTENWYAALSLALTLPDICGRIDDPAAPSGRRYATWFETYLQDKYRSHVGTIWSGHFVTFMTGSDLYALRCAYLHQGEFGIDDQRARQVVSRFVFRMERNGNVFHSNKFNDVLHLDVSVFCGQLCAAVLAWLEVALADPDRSARVQQLATIHYPRPPAA